MFKRLLGQKKALALHFAILKTNVEEITNNNGHIPRIHLIKMHH